MSARVVTGLDNSKRSLPTSMLLWFLTAEDTAFIDSRPRCKCGNRQKPQTKPTFTTHQKPPVVQQQSSSRRSQPYCAKGLASGTWIATVTNIFWPFGYVHEDTRSLIIHKHGFTLEILSLVLLSGNHFEGWKHEFVMSKLLQHQFMAGKN